VRYDFAWIPRIPIPIPVRLSLSAIRHSENRNSMRMWHVGARAFCVLCAVCAVVVVVCFEHPHANLDM
jgi:hypothetical protein